MLRILTAKCPLSVIAACDALDLPTQKLTSVGVRLTLVNELTVIP
jgi:hypothetical protein